MKQPIFIILNGSPASGKTSVARPLAEAFDVPLFEKDAIKERFADVFEGGAEDYSRELGEGANLQLEAIADELLSIGHGVMIESFFEKGASEEGLIPLIEKSRAIQIHVTADHDELIRRYEDRADSPERHPIHQDDERIDKLKELLASGACDPLALGIPTIELDTTHDEIDVDAVVAQAKERFA